MTGRASESGRITFHSAANLSTGTDTHVRVRVSVRLLQAARIFSSTRQGLCGRHNKIYKLRPGENKSEQDSSRVLMVVSGADARSLSVELVDYASTSDSTVCARSVGQRTMCEHKCQRAQCKIVWGQLHTQVQASAQQVQGVSNSASKERAQGQSRAHGGQKTAGLRGC